MRMPYEKSELLEMLLGYGYHSNAVKHRLYLYTKYGKEISLLMDTMEERVKSLIPDIEMIMKR